MEAPRTADAGGADDAAMTGADETALNGAHGQAMAAGALLTSVATVLDRAATESPDDCVNAVYAISPALDLIRRDLDDIERTLLRFRKAA